MFGVNADLMQKWGIFASEVAFTQPLWHRKDVEQARFYKLGVDDLNSEFSFTLTGC